MPDEQKQSRVYKVQYYVFHFLSRIADVKSLLSPDRKGRRARVPEHGKLTAEQNRTRPFSRQSGHGPPVVVV